MKSWINSYLGGADVKRIVLIILACLLFTGCTGAAKAEKTVFAMDTVMNLQIWGTDGEKAAQSFAQMLKVLEETWAVNGEKSVVSSLNQGTAELTEEQQMVIQRVQALSDRTGGAFNPWLGKLSQVWGFYDGANQKEDFHLPSQEQIRTAAGEKRWDLGAAIKGYAGDRAVQILESMNVECAILNLGGNVQTYGTKPNGEAWRIGIQNPWGGDNIGVIAVEGTCSVVTSGDYQRYFEKDGVRYHHILNPETGYPANSGLSSVTVVCRDGMTADGLSTALFVMGLENAGKFWRQSDDFEAVFLLNDGTVYATEGVRLTGCKYEVITREK